MCENVKLEFLVKKNFLNIALDCIKFLPNFLMTLCLYLSYKNMDRQGLIEQSNRKLA